MRRRAVVLAAVCATLLVASFMGTASHPSVTVLAATQASGAWSTPAAVTADDSQSASTSSDAQELSIDQFSSGSSEGSVTGVELIIDHRQVNHRNDELAVAASTPGCSSVAPSPAAFEAASSRQDQVVTLSCGSGWTWSAVNGLSATITSKGVGGGGPRDDGAWHVYYVVLRVTASDQVPAASAGPDQTVDEGDPVMLDGTASSDPEGGSLSYSWTQIEGPSATLSSTTAASASFTAPALSSGTSSAALGFELTVTDPQGHSDTDAVQVTVRNVNQAPMADAGDDRVVSTNTSVSLDGTGSSDPDGDPLAYAWRQTAGPNVTLDGAATAGPTFSAPAAPVGLVFELVVTDSEGVASDPDSVAVRVVEGVPPVTEAPADGVVEAVVFDPPALAVEPGGSASVGVRVHWTDGTVLMPQGGCTWETAAAGGSIRVAGSSSCEVVFTAGSTGGTGYALRAQWEDRGGHTWTARGPVAIGFAAVADGSGGCTAQAAVVAGEAPAVFAPPCPAGLEFVGVGLPSDGTVALVSAAPLGQPPAGLPAEDPEGAFAYDVRVTTEDGAPLDPMEVRLVFTISEDAYRAACADGGCTLDVFHYDGASWRSLEAHVTHAGGAHTVRATTDALSPVAVVAMPPTAAPSASWTLAAVAAATVGGGGAVVWAVRARRRRRPAPTRQARPAEADRPARTEGPMVPTEATVPEEVTRRSLVDELRSQELLQFLNNAAHDLASPLTPIKLQLALLEPTEEEEMTDRQRKALVVVARNIEHMGMLVSDLREAARIQAGKLHLFPEPVDLIGVVEDAWTTFSDAAAAQGIELKLNLDASALPVAADRGRLTQVMYNLLSNALKFTSDGGRVELAAEARGPDALVTVSDTGLGLSQEAAERLFQPFSQVHGAKEKKKGSGLGLFISKGIVESHEGRIWCESRGPDQGSSFRFTIPLRDRQSGPRVASWVTRLRMEDRQRRAGE